MKSPQPGRVGSITAARPRLAIVLLAILVATCISAWMPEVSQLRTAPSSLAKAPKVGGYVHERLNIRFLFLSGLSGSVRKHVEDQVL